MEKDAPFKNIVCLLKICVVFENGFSVIVYKPTQFWGYDNV